MTCDFSAAAQIAATRIHWLRFTLVPLTLWLDCLTARKKFEPHFAPACWLGAVQSGLSGFIDFNREASRPSDKHFGSPPENLLSARLNARAAAAAAIGFVWRQFTNKVLFAFLIYLFWENDG